MDASSAAKENPLVEDPLLGALTANGKYLCQASLVEESGTKMSLFSLG